MTDNTATSSVPVYVEPPLVDEFPQWVRPGTSYRFTEKRHVDHGIVFHIRGLVDGVAVMRHWSKSKGWIYSFERYTFFHVISDHIEHFKSPNK